MKQKLSQIHAPAIAGVMRERNVRCAIAEINNICVNAISPGAIERDGKRGVHMTYMGENGMGGTTKDIADTVLFLAYQDYITGENIIVDGGRTLGPSHR